MTTFDPNKLDLDNLDKSPEHDSVKESGTNTTSSRVNASNSSQKDVSKSVDKKPDPLDQVKAEKKQYTVEKDISTQEIEKQDTEKSMLSEIIESNDNPENKATKTNPWDSSNGQKTIYDVNISSLDDIIKILLSNEYDFVTIEPEEEVVKVIFRQDKTPVNTKFIKYVTYTKLLLKIKSLTKLTVEDTESTQTGAGEYKYAGKWYKIASKTSPSSHGEKVFFKASEVAKKVAVAKNQQASFKTMLKFIGIVAFLFLILWGGFITFVVLNAKTVEDVNFFRSLGINPSDINVFIQQIVTYLFAFLVFLETIFVVIYGFKFFLTKKSQKAKKIAAGILATIFLIVTFATATLWLLIDKKVKLLPNWWDVARGNIQIYDTDILASEKFNKDVAQLTWSKLTQLIGPVNLRFDVSVLADSEARKWFKIEKYIWDFGDGWVANKDSIIETSTPVVFYTFDQQKNYNITLTLQWTDAVNKPLEKVQEIPKIQVTDLINIEEKVLDSGGKMVKFNAESLKQKWTLEWYYGDDYETPVSKWYIFQPWKPIFNETTIALYIKNSLEKTDKKFDRIFVIKPESDDNISGDIVANADPDNILKYTFSVANVSNDFGGGNIESVKWFIDDKEFLREWSVENLEKTSRVDYEFKKYGEHEIEVLLTDSLGKSNTLTQTINIKKQLVLETPLEILDAGSVLEGVSYKSKLGQYWVDELPIPTKLTFSARKVKPKDNLYSLSDVKWDFNNDGDIDAKGKYVEYDIPVAGDFIVTAYYTFSHRTREVTLESQEKIYIQAIKKDAIIKLNIEKDTQYVPVTVRFDASQSSVLGEDIVKFEYDYGDGITEERDAINEWHIYREPGEYDVTVTVTTKTWKKYSLTKKLVLKNRPDIVKITPSLYSAPTFQEIDFSSDDSSGQIVSYFWTFGDGNSSTQANPSHSYTQPGEYIVKLLIEFDNNNTKTDEIKVNILP